MAVGRKPKVKLKETSTGITSVDALSVNVTPSIQDYLRGVSQYIREVSGLSPGQAKSAQIALSAGLGRCLAAELKERIPGLDPYAGELTVAGALRSTRADVSESDPLDGLRLAIEIKPVNLAVGRAIWNRFGDIRAFAVNIHLKFPFAVVAGVLAVPTWEWAKSGANIEDLATESPNEPDASAPDDVAETHRVEDRLADLGPGRVDTRPVIERLVARLRRTRRRETEADAPHLLEAVTVLVYDPSTGALDADLPPVGSGLRWDEFLQTIVETYELRFE